MAPAVTKEGENAGSSGGASGGAAMIASSSSTDVAVDRHLSLIASQLLHAGDHNGKDSSINNKNVIKNADDLEIGLRRKVLDLSRNDGKREKESSSSSIKEIGSFWKRSLGVCREILLDLNEQGQQQKQADGSAEGAAPVVITAPQIAKIPFVLLDDIFDVLLDRDCAAFWNDYVETSIDILFDTDDNSGGFWMHHTCWLAFLKLCNKLIKRGTTNSIPPTLVATIMKNLAAAYPLNDKSATKVWGSRNTETLAEFEDKDEFDKQSRASQQQQKQQQQDSNINKDSSADMDDFYTLYESFWSLQQDFTSPYVKNLASFLLRLRTLLQAMEQQKDDYKDGCDDNIDDPITGCQKYLTSSRLLTSQLSSPSFCHTVLLQFFIVAHSLSAQAPTVGQRLQTIITRAQKLLPQAHWDILQAVMKTDDEWSHWKKTKHPPVLEKRKKKNVEDTNKEGGKPAAAGASTTASKKRKRLDGGSPLSSPSKAAKHDTNLTPSVFSSDNLAQMSVNLRQVEPSLDTHLAEYIDALDPNAGIESEYNPKNNRYFSWQAIRLLSQQHLQDFTHVLPNGDFENVVRHVYKKKGVDIPGEPIKYPEELHDLDEQEAVEEEQQQQQEENHKDDDKEQEQMKEGAQEDGVESSASNKDDECRGDDVDRKDSPAATAVKEEEHVQEGPPTREESKTNGERTGGQGGDYVNMDGDKRGDDRRSEDRAEKYDGGAREKDDRREGKYPEDTKRGNDDRKDYRRSDNDSKRDGTTERRADDSRRADVGRDSRPEVRHHHRDPEQNGDKAPYSRPGGPRSRSENAPYNPPPMPRGRGSSSERGGRPIARDGRSADRERHSPPRMQQQDAPSRDSDRWRLPGSSSAGGGGGSSGAGGRDRGRRGGGGGRSDPEERGGRDDRDDRRGSGGRRRDDQRGGGERWEDRREDRRDDWRGRDHSRRRGNRR